VALEAIALGVPLIISKIPEFERFGLPSQNYFASVSDFVEKFTQHRNSRDFFKVPLEARGKIIGGRNLRIVGSAWIKLLGRC
jgi:hypothetical protein